MNLASRPAIAARAPDDAYRNSRNRLDTLSSAIRGVSETMAETRAESTQKAATRWKGPKCRARGLLIQTTKPPKAPTARNSQRRDIPVPLNGRDDPPHKNA